ncbi:hypothetical protein PR202_gb09392 [Eleusine coracana subsp. coracana]|uniref:BRX domain-containing protein n=1 Tax=Eleusine coracana subsp. coracana TaxID=191504 RepID=A0AAV5EI53_ELECO|nr:hypothetical protein PR202_gb09392 [Eleusine coracana subsp. coracana]
MNGVKEFIVLGLWKDQCQRSQWFPHKLIGPSDGISVSKIACAQWHTAIISSSGQLFTYGDGTFGVLGHGDTCSITQPKEVESLRGLRAKCVACGPWHTAAIVETLGTTKSNAPGGKLFTWGDADRLKLGHTDKKLKLVPTRVESLIDCDFSQVITLAEECRHRSLKVQLYKRKVEETCLTVRDEATKCKAAQEIIKVLTNQRNALSKTLSGGMELEDSRIKPSCVTTKQPVTSELPDPPDKTIVTGKFPHIIGSRNQHNTAKMDMLSEPTFNVDDLVVHQNRRRMPNGSSDYDSGTDTINVPSDCSGVIEQIERGVYVTVVTSPSGKKGIKRIKFSRKHFGQKEAQKWWEENKSRVFEKYSFMEHFAV